MSTPVAGSEEKQMKKKPRTFRIIAALMAGLMIATAPITWAASRRESAIALDPTADITDVYAFRAGGSTKVFIMNVIRRRCQRRGQTVASMMMSCMRSISTNGNGKAEDVRLNSASAPDSPTI
jgi:hypothetical protein